MNVNRIIQIVLTAAVIVFGLLYFTEKSARISASDKYLKEKSEALDKQRDSLETVREDMVTVLERKLMNLTLTEQTIKYVPYEKTVYIDRTLDEALDVFAEHPANKGAGN